MQSRIALSASGPVSGNMQPPVSHPQHSSSAKAHAAPPVSPKPPVPMYRLLLWNFLLQGRTGQWGKIRRIGNNFRNSATKNHGAGENCCTKKSLWTLLMKTRRTRANKSGRAEDGCGRGQRRRGQRRPHSPLPSSPPPQQPGKRRPALLSPPPPRPRPQPTPHGLGAT